MGHITLTAEARRYLTPRTVEALGPHKPGDRAALFAKLCEGARLFGTAGWTDEASLAQDGPAARALLSGGIEPTAEPTTQTWAIALRLSFEKKSGVAYLVQRLGVVAAFEVLLEASHIDYEADVRRQHTTLHRRPTLHPLLDTGIDAHLLRASERERAAVRAISDARYVGAPFVEQMVHVEARFDRPEWADALVTPWLARPRRDSEGWRVLIARIGTLELARPLLADAVSSSVVDLLRFGDAALPLLIEALPQAEDAHRIKHLSRAVALFDDPRAADALAPIATRAPAQPYALAFFQRHPREAARVLAPLSQGKSKAAEKVRELLRRVPEGEAPEEPESEAAAEPESETAAKPESEAAPKPARAKRTKADTSTKTIATKPNATKTIATKPIATKPIATKTAASAIPAVLREPPWAQGKKFARKPIVIAPLVVPCPDAILPDPAETDRRAELITLLETPLDAAERKALYDWVESDQPRGQLPIWTRLPRAEAIALYARWPRARFSFDMELDALALYGVDALEGLLRHAEQALAREFAQTWLLRVASPRLAMILLRARSIDQDGVIGDWLKIHPAAAIAGVLPVAVGPLGADRTLAEAALIELERLHGRDAIFDAAPSARAACEEIFAHALTIFGPARPPKIEGELAGLPAVRLRGGGALSDEALSHLVGYLSSSTLALRHPALASVIEACEPRDLAELGWTLARSWEIGRAKKIKTWMIDALAPLADDDVVRRMLPGLKKARALTVLSSIATDAAAIELTSNETSALAHQARRELMRIAARRAQTRDELEESLAPTFLEGRTMALTLGGEAYTVRLDGALALRIEDASGKALKRLPRADEEGDDDARMRARHDELVRDVARLTPRRLRLLERRMIYGTTMTFDALMTWHLGHPLWASIARGLVWSWQLPSGETGTFRITEDGTFEDEQEKTWAAPKHARFGLPHPLRLPPEVRARWATLLGDYGIVQPFPQIGRAVTLPTKAELKESVLRRPATLGVEEHTPGALDRGLSGSGPAGWQYQIPASGRVLTLRGPKSPPYYVEMSQGGGTRIRTPAPLSTLDPVVLAEHFHALGA